MTAATREALDAFSAARPELATPEAANGECFTVANALIDFLAARGRRAYLLHWRAEHPAEGVIEITNGPDTPEDVLDVYRQGSDPWWMYHGHYAVEVDGMGVDFTARQFSADVAFPLVWESTTQEQGR